ncbi:MAG: glycosyltransferase [Candidatus Obscuribacterales bacterium]
MSNSFTNPSATSPSVTDHLSRVHRVCCLCQGSDFVYLFAGESHRVVKCCACELLRREPPNAFALAEEPVSESEMRTELLAIRHYIQCLDNLGLVHANVLLGRHTRADFWSEALQQAGHSVTLLDTDIPAPHPGEADRLQGSDLEALKFDCVILYQRLERSPEPLELLASVRRLLKDDGHLFLVSLSLDSSPARMFGKQWIGWKSGQNYFFSRSTLQMLLEKAGFNQIQTAPDRRQYSFEYAARQLMSLSSPVFRQLIFPFLTIAQLLVKEQILSLQSSAMIIAARKSSTLNRHKLSVIMPVFNEKNTFQDIFAQVNRKITEGIEGIDDVEVIIVESNSNDGSRELVKSVQSENVKVLLEEKPQGKGHAVRTGLKAATGEICIIQDADLEYDVDDYDALIAPIVEYKKTFILGTRHAGQWKIREFAGEAMMAALFNFGHILFTAIINIFFGQKLTDPFTMYKVFRRECIYGLKFECNRFDFDHELVIKLIKKGYTPEEIPVNYKSRGFAEGKKVTVIRDPITWIIADVKYFFVSPFEESVRKISSS